MYKVLALLLLCGSISAATLEEDVWKLADENYDVREAATAKLIDYPLEYVNIFLAMSVGVKVDPEVQWRLRTAARLCYHKHVTMKSRDFLREIAELDFEAYLRYLNIEEVRREITDPNTGQIHVVIDHVQTGPVAWVVTAAWGENGLKFNDCIMKVNGEDHNTHQGWMAGKTYELQVRRFKIPEDSDLPSDTSDLEFEDLKVTYTVGTKDKSFWNWDRLDIILDSAWARYKAEYDQKYGSLDDPKPVLSPVIEADKSKDEDKENEGVVEMIIDALFGE